MKSLEEQVKASFDHFEPEVDSSVWTKVSQQLPGSAAPAPNVGSAIKGAVVQSGTISTWIAAAAAVIAGAGLIYYFGVKQPESAQQNQPSVVPVTTVITDPAVQVENSQQATTNAELATGNQKPSNKNTPDVSTNTVAAGQPSASTQGSPVDDAANRVSAEHGTVVNSAPSTLTTTNPNKETPSAHPEPTANNSGASSAQAKNAPEPALMLNTKGGFAPLTVTAMTNQLNQPADFDFGDGHQTSQSTSASNRYDEAGTYTITCTTGSKTLETTVEILGQVSSAFSPNGDGINDLFTVGNPDVQNVEISLFNRYGKLVFSGKGKTVNWDGRLQNGVPAESGTYFYDIFVTSGNGNSYKQKGAINLFR